jgi:tetratricopeptide (TPR) repeat protein
MRQHFSVSVLAAFSAIFCSEPLLADPSWTSCAAAPTRGCVLDQALEISRESGGWRINALTAIAEAQAAGSQRLHVAAISDEAVQVLDATHEDGRRRAVALSRLAAAQARAGLTEKAHAIIGQAIEIVQSVDEADAFKQSDLVEIASGQAEAGNSEDALRVLGLITKRESQAIVIGSIAREQAKAGRFADALKLAETIAREDTGEVLKFIADEQIKSGLKNEARSTLAEAAELASSRTHWINGDRVKLLVSIASSQANLDLITEALSTLDAALQVSQSIELSMGMAPPPIVQRINAVIDVAEAEARLGTVERAAADFVLARQLTEAIDQEKWQRRSYDNVLLAQRHWRAYAFAAIANAQSKAGLLEDAKMTIEIAMPLAQSIDDRVPPDLPGRAQVLSLIASAQVKLDRTSAVAELVPLIKQDSWRAKVLEGIALAGRTDEALHLASFVDDERDRAMLLSTIADGLSRAHDLSGVAAVANSIKDGYWRAHATGAVARAQARMGLWSDAGATIDRLAKIVAAIDQGSSRDQAIEEVVEQLCAFAKLLPD